MIITKGDKKHFNNNLVMSEKDKQIFQSSEKRWICDNLLNAVDNKVRYHCHVTRKYRGSARWRCNNNLRLTKNCNIS